MAALARLCRRSFGNSGSSVAASMVGRGLEIRQVIGAAATRPLLRPASVRNLEGWRRFSTEGTEGAGQDKPLLMRHKVESILLIWWQRSRNSVKNVIKGDQSTIVYIGSAAYLCFLAFHLPVRPPPWQQYQCWNQTCARSCEDTFDVYTVHDDPSV